MWFHVLACDYDGTLATEGRIATETFEALRRVRDSGRRVLLVTGRQMDDLLAVCPEIDFFDLVVAENGAVLYDPAAKRPEDLVAPPPVAFLGALEQAGVPFSAGRVIVATVVPHEVGVLETIRRMGLELHIIFNKEAVMILPSGVSKETGLAQALLRLGISRHNTIAVGDAENDHAFLGRCGFAVAVANAVPALAAQADLVTSLPNGAGVRAFIDGPLQTDLESEYHQRSSRRITLGTRPDGTPFTYPVCGPNLLVTGTSGTGKSTLTGVFLEQLARDDYVFCLLDPEGDARGLAELEGVVVLTSEQGTAATRAAEVERLLRNRSTSVAIDLSQLDRDEKIRAAAEFLHAVQHLRAETGAPHWLVLDEAHHLFPPGRSAAQAAFDPTWRGVCLITNEPGLLDPQVLATAQYVFSTSVSAVTERLPLLPRNAIPGDELDTGEALAFPRPEDDVVPTVERFRVARRETEHKRHVKKYATGKLPPERAFHFRGPEGSQDLVAHNLETFSMLAKGVDAVTWQHHLQNGDIARWLRDEIKDAELADEVEAMANGGDADAARREALAAIARRYTPVSTAES